MMPPRSSMKRRHMAIVHGTRVYTKDTIAAIPTTTAEVKAVDTKVEVPIKVEAIKDVAVVVAVAIKDVAVVMAEEAEVIITEGSIIIKVAAMLMDTIINKVEDTKKDTSKDTTKDMISRVLLHNKSSTILEWHNNAREHLMFLKVLQVLAKATIRTNVVESETPSLLAPWDHLHLLKCLCLMLRWSLV